MSKPGNYAGVDILNPPAPDAVEEAELEGDHRDEDDLFDFDWSNIDLSTLAAASNAVRAVSAIFLLHFSVGFFRSVANQMIETSPSFAIEVGVFAFILLVGIFTYLHSRLAVILAGVYVGIMWIEMFFPFLEEAGRLRIPGGVSGLLLATATVGVGLAGAFSYHRLKRQEQSQPDPEPTP